MPTRGRSQILLTGKLYHEGEWRPFRVKDISSRGVKGHGIPDLSADLKVQVSIRDSEQMAGHIVWSEGLLFGVRFTFPINPEVFRLRITGSYERFVEPDQPFPLRRPV